MKEPVFSRETVSPKRGVRILKLMSHEDERGRTSAGHKRLCYASLLQVQPRESGDGVLGDQVSPTHIHEMFRDGAGTMTSGLHLSSLRERRWACGGARERTRRSKKGS